MNYLESQETDQERTATSLTRGRSRNLLVVEGREPVPASFNRILDHCGHDVFRIQGGAGVADYLDHYGFQLMLIFDPLGDLDTVRLLDALRERIDPASFPTTLILATQSRLERFEDLVDHSVSVLSTDADSTQTKVALSRFLQAPPRAARRVFVRLTAIVGRGQVLRVAQTENVSETGVLLRGSLPLPVGTSVQVQFELAEGSRLRAEGRVIRTLPAAGHEPGGIAVAFTSLSRTSFEILRSFIADTERSNRKKRRKLEPAETGFDAEEAIERASRLVRPP